MRSAIHHRFTIIVFDHLSDKNESLNELCANTDCIMFLMNKAYLKQILSDVKIHHIENVITVQDIKTITHNCFEYVNLKLFIFEILKVATFKRIAKLTRYAHIVDNLRAKFLMRMNILRSKKIVLNIFKRKMILSLCENLKINIKIISHTLDAKALNKRMNRVIQSKQLIFISFRTMTIVLIKTRKTQILSDRDYIFQLVKQELNLERTDEMMTHIINVNLAAMRVINFTNKSVIISRKTRLNRLIKYEKHECYVTNSTKTSLATEFFWRKIAVMIIIYIDTKSASSTKKFREKKFFNEIIAYDTFTVRQQLFDTVEKYSLWDKTENIVINVLEDEWISIILKSEIKIEAIKVYSMRSKKRELINETFDKLHHQNKMHWIIEFIAHDASVFVI